MSDDRFQFATALLSWSRRAPGTTAVLRRSGDAWEEIARTEATEHRVAGLHPATAHEFAAASVDAAGGLAPEDEWERVRVAPLADAGTPAKPEAPAGFAAVQEGPLLHFSWEPASDGLAASYEIREGADWNDGLVVAAGLPGPPFSWPWRASGQATFKIAARDKLGRQGPVSSAGVDVRPLGTHVEAAESDEGGGGWTGTKDGMEVDGGSLVLAELPKFGGATEPFGSFGDVPCFARRRAVGSYTTATLDLGQVEDQRVEIGVAAESPSIASLPFGAVKTRALGTRRRRRDGTLNQAGLRGWANTAGIGGRSLRAPDVEIEIETSLAGAGDLDGWRPWIPGTYRFRRMRLRATVRGDGFRSVALTDLVIRRLKLNLKDEGAEETDGVNAAAVTFAMPFTSPPRVVAQVIDGLHAHRVLVSSVTASGCELDAVDGSGARVAKEVHWHALGT